MNIRIKYFLFVAILHIILTILVFKILEENKFLFILSEALILVSLLISYSVYKSFIRPIELMKSGTNAIKDEDFNIKYLKTGSSDVDHLITTFNEMIDRLRVEKLRTIEQSYFLENLIEESPVGVIIMDFDHKISDINDRAAQFLSVVNKDAIGRSLDHIPGALAHFLTRLDDGEKKVVSVYGNQKFKIYLRSIIHKGFMRKFIMIEELSEEILEAERQAYGKVIRMMAHEVNNSIGAINSILQTTKENAFPVAGNAGSDWKEALQVAIDRNQQLDRFMKNFAKVVKIPDPEFSSIDLNAVVSRTANAMKNYSANRNILLHIELAAKEIRIRADEALLEQVLVNILKNAIESIEENGEIRVNTSLLSPQLVIRDNGKGIPKDITENLFTPFYSTKQNGQGIGLMLTKEILSKHRANFDLYTDHDSGWTFFKVGFGI